MWNYVHQHTLVSQVLLFRGAAVLGNLKYNLVFLQPARQWGQGWCWAPGPPLPLKKWLKQLQLAFTGCSFMCTRTGRLPNPSWSVQREQATKGSSWQWTRHSSAGASMTCATSSSFLPTSGRCQLVGCGTSTWQCHGHHEVLGGKFASGTRNFFQVPHAALGNNWACISRCAWAMICFGPKLSFLGCLQAVKDTMCQGTWGCGLTKLEGWGISLYICQYILGRLQNSAGHSRVQPALTLNLDPGAELAVLWMGVWTKCTKGPFQPMLWSLRTYVILWHCTGSRAMLLPTTEPLSKQL